MIDLTQHFHESNLIEGIDSPAADECLKEAWKYLEQQDVLDKGVICRVQKIATLHQKDLQPDWRGYYRKIPVYIGGHEAVHPVAIDAMMADFIYMSNWKEKSPKELHIEFERIHPFVDGNGRTGRLLMWWQECREGKDPTLIKNADKNKAYGYYDWFRLDHS